MSDSLICRPAPLLPSCRSQPRSGPERAQRDRSSPPPRCTSAPSNSGSPAEWEEPQLSASGSSSAVPCSSQLGCLSSNGPSASERPSRARLSTSSREGRGPASCGRCCRDPCPKCEQPLQELLDRPLALVKQLWKDAAETLSKSASLSSTPADAQVFHQAVVTSMTSVQTHAQKRARALGMLPTCRFNGPESLRNDVLHVRRLWSGARGPGCPAWKNFIFAIFRRSKSSANSLTSPCRPLMASWQSSWSKGSSASAWISAFVTSEFAMSTAVPPLQDLGAASAPAAQSTTAGP
mmetsp:Transcript_82733/g.229644  ORF Transcript_82733/g.229644 Transcript_82733/m.229644 type:complete len:293 (+) Transcript_82733:669-1547(+)